MKFVSLPILYHVNIIPYLINWPIKKAFIPLAVDS